MQIVSIIMRLFVALGILFQFSSCMMTSRAFGNSVMGNNSSQASLLGAVAVDVVTFPVQVPVVAVKKAVGSSNTSTHKESDGQKKNN